MSTWYESAVFYHIYPLGLCGAPKINNEAELQHHMTDLEKWIPHIKGIGCTGIYIGPLFESVGHGYETTDYKLVDKRLGTNEDFKSFVNECHKSGIKVIVDGVFNHTGREFFAFKDIRENLQNSIYKNWYCNVNFNGNTEYNDGFSYDAWGGYNLLAKLDQRNPEVKRYLFDVIRFWVSEFDIDGIRLDAADVLDFDFMHEMRLVANEVKEDFWLMGEVIHGDYSRWANNDMLHSVTNYELHKGLFSGHNDHNYFEIAHTVKRINSLCGDTKLYTFVDNHDVNRIQSKLIDKEHLYPVYLILYTLPGIPSLYYGSEFSISGEKENGSDDGIRPYINLDDYCDLQLQNEWSVDYYKDGDYLRLLKLIASLGEAKKKYKELNYGEYKELTLTNRQFSFARILDNSAVITIVNNDNKEVQMNLCLPIPANTATDILTGENIKIENGCINLTIHSNGGSIIHIS